MSELLNTARARLTRCLWPPERLMPWREVESKIYHTTQFKQQLWLFMAHTPPDTWMLNETWDAEENNTLRARERNRTPLNLFAAKLPLTQQSADRISLSLNKLLKGAVKTQNNEKEDCQQGHKMKTLKAGLQHLECLPRLSSYIQIHISTQIHEIHLKFSGLWKKALLAITDVKVSR